MVGADEFVSVGTNVSANTIVGSIDSVGTMDGTEVIDGLIVGTSRVGDSVGDGGSTGVGVGCFDGLLVGLRLINLIRNVTIISQFALKSFDTETVDFIFVLPSW